LEGDALYPDAAYIFRKQIEEADLLIINKSDAISPEDRRRLEGVLAAQFPGMAVRYLSARTGEGVETWLDEVLLSPCAGARIVEVDYDVYAAGEAALGWLNADVLLSAVAGPVPWRTLCSDLLVSLQAAFCQRNARIGHVKLLLAATDGHYVGNFTDGTSSPSLQGQIAGASSQADLTLNARVEMVPDELERVVRAVLGHVADGCVRAEFRSLRCLSPGRPRPTYRYDRVVG